MTRRALVEQLVRRWALDLGADGSRVVDSAVEIASEALSAGASAGDAYLAARRYLECWARHPANRRARSARCPVVVRSVSRPPVVQP